MVCHVLFATAQVSCAADYCGSGCAPRIRIAQGEHHENTSFVRSCRDITVYDYFVRERLRSSPNTGRHTRNSRTQCKPSATTRCATRQEQSSGPLRSGDRIRSNVTHAHRLSPSGSLLIQRQKGIADYQLGQWRVRQCRHVVQSLSDASRIAWLHCDIDWP
jgi:hypothetical protein